MTMDEEHRAAELNENIEAVRAGLIRRWCILVTSAALFVVGGAIFLPELGIAADGVRPKHSFVAVNFPCRVSDTSEVRKTPVGDIVHHTVSGTTEGVAMSITATELPSVVTALAADPLLMFKARREMLKEFDAETQRWENCDYDDIECRLFEYSAPGGHTGRAKILLDDDILVVVNAFGRDNPLVVDAFLGSIH